MIPYVNPCQIFKPATDIPNTILTDGPNCRNLEEMAADYLGAKYAVACASGTIALYCVYRALGLKGKTVAMPSFTWRSTAEAALMAGAKPVFFDIDDTFCIDIDGPIDSLDAVVAVDCFGCPSDYEKLLRQNKTLIVDSAHSFGMKYQGKKTGGYGVRCYSMSPTKVLVANEGGLITCNDESLAGELKSLRRWAGRMTEFNAACAINGLMSLDGVLDAKRLIAGRYREFALNVGWQVQEIPRGHNSTFKDVAIVFGSTCYRDAIQQFLCWSGIETKIYFVPCHVLPHLQGSDQSTMRKTEQIWRQSLCLPSWPGVDQNYIIKKMEEFIICQDGKNQKMRFALESVTRRSLSQELFL